MGVACRCAPPVSDTDADVPGCCKRKSAAHAAGPACRDGDWIGLCAWTGVWECETGKLWCNSERSNAAGAAKEGGGDAAEAKNLAASWFTPGETEY